MYVCGERGVTTCLIFGIEIWEIKIPSNSAKFILYGIYVLVVLVKKKQKQKNFRECRDEYPITIDDGEAVRNYEGFFFFFHVKSLGTYKFPKYILM